MPEPTATQDQLYALEQANSRRIEKVETSVGELTGRFGSNARADCYDVGATTPRQ